MWSVLARLTCSLCESMEKSTDSERKISTKAYSREFKLNVSWFFKNGKKVDRTARNFQIDKKMVRTWIIAEEKIRKQKPHSKASGWGRQALFSSIEKKLHEEFKTLSKDSKIVKRWWFNNRVKQLLKEQNPSEADDVKALDHWFSAFCRRYGISLRRKTHTSQKAL